jgi:hypothetical protein
VVSRFWKRSDEGKRSTQYSVLRIDLYGTLSLLATVYCMIYSVLIRYFNGGDVTGKSGVFPTWPAANRIARSKRGGLTGSGRHSMAFFLSCFITSCHPLLARASRHSLDTLCSMNPMNPRLGLSRAPLCLACSDACHSAPVHHGFSSLPFTPITMPDMLLGPSAAVSYFRHRLKFSSSLLFRCPPSLL